MVFKTSFGRVSFPRTTILVGGQRFFTHHFPIIPVSKKNDMTRDNDEQCETLKQMYRGHGWTRLDSK